jgi:transcriptional regulator with XRE-family HTH domain
MRKKKARRRGGRSPNVAGQRTAAQLRAKGWSLRRIAEHMGTSFQNVAHLLKRASLPPRSVLCRACRTVFVTQPPAGDVGVSAWCPGCLRHHPEAPLGERLKTFRLVAGLTQQALAREVRIGQSTVHRLEAGAARLPWRVLAALIRRFGVALVDVEGVLSSGGPSPSPRSPESS